MKPSWETGHINVSINSELGYNHPTQIKNLVWIPIGYIAFVIGKPCIIKTELINILRRRPVILHSVCMVLDRAIFIWMTLCADKSSRQYTNEVANRVLMELLVNNWLKITSDGTKITRLIQTLVRDLVLQLTSLAVMLPYPFLSQNRLVLDWWLTYAPMN